VLTWNRERFRDAESVLNLARSRTGVRDVSDNIRLVLVRWWREAHNPLFSSEVQAAFNVCARELQEAMSEHDDAMLSPKEAARECRWTVGTIRKMLADGRLPNEGSPGRPKVRRKALQDAVNGTRKLRVVG
jgi:hypothetical protein